MNCTNVERLVADAAQPWWTCHGDLPDYDHPLRCVFESGVQYAVELLAKTLDVDDWTPCDGTEEFDGDLGGTLMNIVLAAMPTDEHGDAIYPKDLRAPSAENVGRMAELRERFRKAVDELPWVRERAETGKQFNCYESGRNDEDDNDEDRVFYIGIGPVTDFRFIGEVTGRSQADLLEAALKLAALSLPHEGAAER